MNQVRIHQLILRITFVISMILTSSAFSKEIENLLMDPDFEEPVLGWSLATRAPAAATLTIDKNEKRVGQASARIEITDVGDGTAVHNLTLDNHAAIAVKANTTYTVDFWTKAEADRTLIIDALLNQGPWTNLFRVRDLSVTTEWTRIHHTFQADATLSPVVFLFSFVDSKTTIWLDHVRFYEGEFDEEDIRQPFASGPDPAHGAFHEDTWVTLTWKPGQWAVSHDVYLGDTFEDVEQATPDSDIFRSNQTTTFYVAGFPGFAYPEGLVPGTTYYWRIDEVNDADPNSPWKGDVWSFSIPPKTAYNPDPADGADSVATDARLSWTPGFGAKLHTVYLGDDLQTVANATVGVPSGTASYNPGSLEQEKVYYWRIDEFDGLATHKGDIWAFATLGAVGNPQPANGATNVGMATILSWTPADNAASHQVYLGLDKDSVRNADTGSPEYKGSKALGDESYDPGLLELGTTYYWRVDAVYNGNPVKGLVWSFTVGDYILVEDFESYTDNDADGEAIWQTWIDGFGIVDNGAQVGYLTPAYAEQTIVHGGSQSMPLLYTNETGVTNSEAVLTLTTLRDWTQAGVSELSLWFRGASGNAAEPLYVAISNNASSPAVVAHDDSDAATGGTWREWRISLSAFADQGTNLSNVDKLAIGLGSKSGMASAGGSGTMFIDDIRLYRQ